MKHEHSASIKRMFDYLKICNDEYTSHLISLDNEHLTNAKIHIVEAIEELALGYAECKKKKQTNT